jgi:GNAT superfamily N-acetyltransferase
MTEDNHPLAPPSPRPPTQVMRPTAQNDVANFMATHVLRGGTEILIRAIHPGDKERLSTAFEGLGGESIYTRFFYHKKELTEGELEQATNADFENVVALVATLGSGDGETIIAGGRYIRLDDAASRACAEVAFTVEEDYQGQGVAGRLLGHLVDIARAKGILEFRADVLLSNKPMLSVFARSGLPMRQQQLGDVIHVILSLAAG